MRGLLLKDWYMVLKYCRMFVLVVAVFLLVSIFGEDSEFFMLYPIFLAGMVPVTLISYDERFKWNTFCQTLPCSRGQYVSGKYVVALMSLVVVWLLTLALQALRLAAVEGVGLTAEALLPWTALLALGLMITGVVLPVIFRFGSEKGRIMNILLVMVAFAAGGALSKLQPEVHASFAPAAGLFLLLLIAMAVFALSWMLSVGLYRKREL